MQLVDRNVAVIGLGKSGVAAAELCLREGSRLCLFDDKPYEALSLQARSLVDGGAELVSGRWDPKALGRAEVVVLSPGVAEKRLVETLGHLPKLLLSELDLASRFVSAPIALVGGTNGKSTVTAWLTDMLEHAGRNPFVGGNFGTPLCHAIGTEHRVLVVEISSFQAEHVPMLRARVCALLNISEDHLDRYEDFDSYAHAKGNPFVNMTADDVAVIPFGDASCAAQAGRGQARVVTFSQHDPQADVRMNGSSLVDGPRDRAFDMSTSKMRGRHNMANACAAVAMASELGATFDAIQASLLHFEGLAHRHDLVAEIDGVRYYDDSKATNVGAAVAALSGLDEDRAVLIAGGRDKLGAFEPLVDALRKRGRGLVAMGEAAARLTAAVGDAVQVEQAADMAEAVSRAAAMARPGDAVLLSPACSSFDMFDSYAHRGDVFVEMVKAQGGKE